MNAQSDFYIKPLDGVRGLAVLMIMFFHYTLIPYNTIFAGLESIIKLGQTGVTLFFVLSGFLITRILIKAKGKENYFRNFYIRRTLRIFPLYFFFLLLTYYVFPLFSIGKTPAVSEQLPFYLFYENIAITFNWAWSGPFQYWSLAVEEHFYLFWPFVIYFVSVKKCYHVILWIVLIAIATRILLFLNGYEVFYFTTCRMDAIAIGCFIALKEYESNYQLKIRWWLHMLFLCVGSVLFCFLWVIYKEQSNLYIQVVKDMFFYYVYFLLIMAVVIYDQNSITNRIKKVFSNTWLQYCGKISFSLYVYHSFCFFLVQLLGIGNFFISILLCFAVAFSCASLSYFYFERPFLKWKDKFTA